MSENDQPARRRVNRRRVTFGLVSCRCSACGFCFFVGAEATAADFRRWEQRTPTDPPALILSVATCARCGGTGAVHAPPLEAAVRQYDVPECPHSDDDLYAECGKGVYGAVCARCGQQWYGVVSFFARLEAARLPRTELAEQVRKYVRRTRPTGHFGGLFDAAAGGD